MFRTIAALLLSLSLCPSVLAQAAPAATASTPPAYRIVRPTGVGDVAVEVDPAWRPSRAVLYDHATPMLQFTSVKVPHASAQYILYAAPSNGASAVDCREAILQPLLKTVAASIVPGTVTRTEAIAAEGIPMATAFFATSRPAADAAPGTPPLRSFQTYGFVAGVGLCAEIHTAIVSTDGNPPPEAPRPPNFRFNATFVPRVEDFTVLANIFYKAMHDYTNAAVYYDDALHALPATPETDPQRNQRRFLTDQLAMSYGMSGDLRRSREVNEAAIAHDPDYPLYYYNLACADAEEGNSDAARTHLQQAFARKSNTLPGEHLPDPRTDSSILKLRKNASFWNFVEALPAS